MTLSQKDTFNKGLHIAGFIASFVKAEAQFKCRLHIDLGILIPLKLFFFFAEELKKKRWEEEKK